MTDDSRVMKVMVTGSRALHKRKDVKKDVYKALDELLRENGKIIVVSGLARGPGRFAAGWTRKNAQRAGTLSEQDRSILQSLRWASRLNFMIDACDIVIAFWDGKCKETSYVLKHAKNKLRQNTEYT